MLNPTIKAVVVPDGGDHVRLDVVPVPGLDRYDSSTLAAHPVLTGAVKAMREYAALSESDAKSRSADNASPTQRAWLTLKAQHVAHTRGEGGARLIKPWPEMVSAPHTSTMKRKAEAAPDAGASSGSAGTSASAAAAVAVSSATPKRRKNLSVTVE